MKSWHPLSSSLSLSLERGLNFSPFFWLKNKANGKEKKKKNHRERL